MWNKSAEELRAALSAPFQSADIGVADLRDQFSKDQRPGSAPM
ncbi:MAG: hypothetical protein ACLVD8_26580 [Enterocloster sp.]